MSTLQNVINTSFDALDSIQKKVETNWKEHKVAILAGTAVAIGGLALVATGGILALPTAIFLAVMACGGVGIFGGLGVASHAALSEPVKDITKPVNRITFRKLSDKKEEKKVNENPVIQENKEDENSNFVPPSGPSGSLVNAYFSGELSKTPVQPESYESVDLIPSKPVDGDLQLLYSDNGSIPPARPENDKTDVAGSYLPSASKAAKIATIGIGLVAAGIGLAYNADLVLGAASAFASDIATCTVGVAGHLTGATNTTAAQVVQDCPLPLAKASAAAILGSAVILGSKNITIEKEEENAKGKDSLQNSENTPKPAYKSTPHLMRDAHGKLWIVPPQNLIDDAEEEIEEAKPAKPASKTSQARKLVGYGLVGTAALVAAAYYINSVHKNDPTLLQTGTTTSASQEGYDFGQSIVNVTSAAWGFFGNALSAGYNSIPSQENIEGWLNSTDSWSQILGNAINWIYPSSPSPEAIQKIIQELSTCPASGIPAIGATKPAVAPGFLDFLASQSVRAPALNLNPGQMQALEELMRCPSSVPAIGASAFGPGF